MKTIVAKFGGTSLADAKQIRKVRDIILENPARRIIAVSAPGKRYPEDVKVTDLLLRCYENAVEGLEYETELNAVEARFRDICAELGVDIDLPGEMAVIRESLCEKPQAEYMASRGEYLNARIIAAFLGYTFVDPAWCVCFHRDGSFDNKTTRRTLSAALRPLDRAVIAGFYGADAEGVIHTFSRGGSDITGSIAARAVDAELYENWTDVSGLLAADPRIVEAPASVDYLSYRELRTLSYMGASVLHTDAVLPVSRAGIPINIRNTNRPQDPGTTIVSKLPEDRMAAAVTGVAGRTGMTVLQVEKVMASDGAGFSAVLLDILRARELPFEECLTGIDTVSLVIQSELFAPLKEEILDEVRTVLRPDTVFVKENLSMIAVVGEAENGCGDAMVKILRSVTDAGIEISTINQGAGGLNLLIGVEEARYEDAIRAIYKAIT